MKNDLFDRMKNLLEYAGTEIKDISQTKDGTIATVKFDDVDHRIFVVPITPKEEILMEYEL